MAEPILPLQLYRSKEFDRWFSRLRDERAQIALDVRLGRLRRGNFGDSRPVGEGVAELRIDVGPGYRVYFVRLGDVIVVLLCGGDKSSQQRDIATAKRLAEMAGDIANEHRT